MTAAVLAALFGGAAAGAVLNQLFGLLTGWIGRRHEVRQWVRDRSLDAYANVTTAFNAWLVAIERVGHVTEEQFDLYRDLVDALGRVQLLAPDSTAGKATELVLAVGKIASDLDPSRPFTIAENEAEFEAAVAIMDALHNLQRRDVQGRRK